MRMPFRDGVVTRIWFWGALLVSITVLVLYAGASFILLQYGPLTRDLGWLAAQSNGAWSVTQVTSLGPAAGSLKPGDRIIAINGDKRAGYVDPEVIFERVPAGTSYSITVQRKIQTPTFTLPLAAKRDARTVYWSITLLIVGLAFYAVGAVIGILKPSDPVARLSFLFTILCSVEMVYQVLQPLHGLLPPPEFRMYAVINFVTYCLPYALGYHLASRFPSPISESPIWIRLRQFIYLLCGALFLPNAFLTVISTLDRETVVQFHSNHHRWLSDYSNWSFLARTTFELLVVIAVAAVLARNYSRITEPDLRRRIRWIAYGTVAGLIPLSGYAIARSFLGLTGNTWFTNSETWLAFTRFTNIAIVVVPLTLGYCVVRHRVLGIDVALRRGFQYLLAKNSLRFLLFLPWLSLASKVALHPEMRIRDLVAPDSVSFYAGTSLAAGVSLRYRKQVMHALDRRFFRESYDQEQILLDLMEQMNSADSVQELSQLVASRLKAALHPESVRVLYREPGTQEISWRESEELEAATSGLGADSWLIPALQQGRTPFEVGRLSSGFPPSAEIWLTGLGIHLVAPILRTDNRVVGALCLGEKKSQEPYTRRDRSLLQMIASQFALEAENIWLRKRVGEEEQVRHDVLAQLGPVPSLIKECRVCGTCFDNSSVTCSRDGSELGLSLPVARILDGKYRLDRRLGTGGMGAVYEAWDVRLSRKVAIKVMMGRLFGDRTSLRRFEREAQASARLNHANIIRVYDFGTIGGGGAYIVMEYLPGVNLRSELKRIGIVPAQVAAGWIDELLAGVAAAHEAGIIHRDLKPENILIARPDGVPEVVKVLDFGVAKMWERLDARTITDVGSVVGTLGYMSPEQMTGHSVDERTDIFSLGVIVVEALTGLRPFAVKSPRELLAAIYNFDLNLEDPSLCRVLRKCLAPDPATRYSSVKQMREELVPAIRASGDFVSGPHLEHGATSTMIAKIHSNAIL